MTNHIQNLQIGTYRGIKGLDIENLGSVNVFVGDNNTGKTSVLESIQLLCNPNKYNLIKIARQREKYRAMIRMGLNILDSVLYMFDVRTCNKEENHYSICVGGTIHNQKGEIKVEGKLVEQLIDLKEVAKFNSMARNKLSHAVVEEREEIITLMGKIQSTFENSKEGEYFDDTIQNFEINEYTRIISSKNENAILDVKLIQTIDHIIENAFNSLIKNKDIKKKAVVLLKEFDETITDIRYINDDNSFVPVIENSDGDYIPLSLYGDGMKKALTMLNAIVNTHNGVVLIDEFETALHTSLMKEVFKFIQESSRTLNVQLFLTTHSLEAVDKLLEGAGEYVGDVRIIRMKKKNGHTIAKVTNGKDALEERKEYNMELRI